jgi:hypothetical protein
MPLPEGYLPREGDVLTVDVEVKHNVRPGDAYIFTKLVDSYGDVALHMKEASTYTLKRRTWREGDEILADEEGCTNPNFGTVLIVDGDRVVVKLNEKSDAFKDDGGLAIFHCNDLLPWPGAKRPDDDEDVVEAEPPPAPLTGSNDPNPSEDEEEIKF